MQGYDKTVFMTEGKYVRQCLFCEQPAKSLEHIWPDWLLALVQRKPYRQRLGSGPEVTLRGDFKARCVCRDCNNGWMSDLEGDARPVLSALMRDMALPLHQAEQQILGSWTLKTAIVLEATKPRRIGRFYTAQEKEDLRTKRLIPKTTKIWIGRFAQSGVASNGSDFTLRLVGEAEDAQASVVTVIVGHVVLQVLSLHYPSNMIAQTVNLEVKAGHWQSSLKQLYPYERTVLWPPVLSFTNGSGELGFEYLKYRWNTLSPRE